MPPRLRKLVLTAHLTSSVGWIGAVAAFLVLAVAGLTSSDGQWARGAYLSMDLVARYAIVPLALATLVVGITLALGTPWGLFRHYWVVVKLVITVIAVIVLLQQLPAIAALAQTATQGPLSGTDLTARTSLVVHSGGGLLVLLTPAVLAVYKPRGRTRHGQRVLRDRRQEVAEDG